MQFLRFYHRRVFIFFGIGVTLLLVYVSHYGIGNNYNAVELVSDAQQEAEFVKYNKNVDRPRLSHRKTVDREEVQKMNNLLLNITEESKCPVCLGTDLCEDISSGFLSLTSLERVSLSTSSLYSGNIGVEHPVFLQVPNADIYGKVEDVLCGGNFCDVKSSSVRWPYISSVKAMTPSHLTKFLEAAGGNPITHPLMMCSSPLSVSVLEAAFTSESASTGTPTPSDKLNLLTALVAAPGYAIQKVAQLLQLSPGIVSIIGACGRSWVTSKDDLTPLSLLLGEEWPVRAALGAQLLSIVEDMLEGSEEWLAMVSLWSVEDLAVTKDGELLLSDAKHTAIIDRAGLTGPSDTSEDDYDTLGETCNKDCFERRMATILSQLPREPADKNVQQLDDRQSVSIAHPCAHEDFFAHLMYASVCAYILSDDEAHRNTRLMDSLPPRQDSQRGLLHSPPPDLQPQLAGLLSSCVVEPLPGDRLRAVEGLKEELGLFGGLDEEDQDYEDEEYTDPIED